MIYRFSAISIRIPVNTKFISHVNTKFTWKFKKTRNAKKTLKVKNKFGGLAHRDFKIHDQQ